MNEIQFLLYEVRQKIEDIYAETIKNKCVSSDSGARVQYCWCPDCKEALKEAKATRREAFRFYGIEG